MTDLSSTQIDNRELSPLQDFKIEININQINKAKSMKAYSVMDSLQQHVYFLELLDGQNRITSKAM